MKKRLTKIVDTTLFVRNAAGEYHIAPLPLVIETARRGLDEKAKTEAFTSPAQAMDGCIVRLSPLEHEAFACVFLDHQHQVMGYAETAQIDGLSLMAKKITVSPSTSGEMPETGLEVLNQDGDNLEVALAKRLIG